MGLVMMPNFLPRNIEIVIDSTRQAHKSSEPLIIYFGVYNSIYCIIINIIIYITVCIIICIIIYIISI